MLVGSRAVVDDGNFKKHVEIMRGEKQNDKIEVGAHDVTPSVQ